MTMASNTIIRTTEMHTGGDPLRIVETGYPDIPGKTILDKMNFCKTHLDHLRQQLMWEPRGHHDMWGALLVHPDDPSADIAAIFLHKDGYSVMCGHGTIALARYAVDHGYVKPTEPVTSVNIQVGIGVVKAEVVWNGTKSASTSFETLPTFIDQLALPICVPGIGDVLVDVAYGGMWFGIISETQLRINIRAVEARDIIDIAMTVKECLEKVCKPVHPGTGERGSIIGLIVTDATESDPGATTRSYTIYAERELTRAPCGTGVSARMAALYTREDIGFNQWCTFQSAVSGSQFTARVVREEKIGEKIGTVIELKGRAFYTGTATYTIEDNDELGNGFIV